MARSLCLVALVLAFASCSPEARRLQTLRERFPSVLGDAGAIAPGPKTAEVTLPDTADGGFQVRDRASGISVSVRMLGASAVAAITDRDLVFFERAAQRDVILRRSAHGVEDFVHYEIRPASETISYRVALGDAAGLRLVANTLEVLDARGVPVLRAAPPFVIDAGSEIHDAVLSVRDCAVDRDPRVPFDRPITPPGARTCTVVVDWSEAHVRYPALVDPTWTSTTNEMVVARTRHTITLLDPTNPASRALIAGGFSAVGGTALTSAEIYEPLSRRFSVTGSLTTARGAHTATSLTAVTGPTGGEKPVLVAGGADSSNTPLASIEVYDPASGTFVVDSNTMAAAPRFEHTATLIGDDTVLLAGGTSVPLNQPTDTAYVYSFAGLVGAPPTSVTSTLVPVAALMTGPRTGHAATRLATGDVLITGGFVLGGGALQGRQDGELFQTGGSTFTAIATAGAGLATMSAQRGYHSSTLLTDQTQVLLVGGLSKIPGGTYTNTIDIYLDGTGPGGDKGFVAQAVPITMTTERASHSATLMPSGRVLIAGGFTTGDGATSTVESFDPLGAAFTQLSTPAPLAARGDAAAVLVNAGEKITAGSTVLVAGGTSAATAASPATSQAALLLVADGEGCTVDAECLSGFCTDGVCCDTRCDAECYACRDTEKETGPSGVCGFAKQGADAHVECVNDVETHTQCDGQGSTEQDPVLTKSCLPATCGVGGMCAAQCTGISGCVATAWCDTSTSSCAFKKSLGDACNAPVQCTSGHCVDGVCCSGACDGQCQACNLAGQIGTCGVVVITTSICTDDPARVLQSVFTSSFCDGATGDQITRTTCGAYTCANTQTCRIGCALDTHCIAGFMCVDGACVEPAPPGAPPPPLSAGGGGCAGASSSPVEAASLLAAFLLLVKRRLKSP